MPQNPIQLCSGERLEILNMDLVAVSIQGVFGLISVTQKNVLLRMQALRVDCLSKCDLSYWN